MLKQGGLFAPVSREGALVLNNLLLTTSCATVFFGTLYPLALEQFTGEKITVGAPFFNMTCGVLMLAAAAVTPVGFGLAWKRGDLLGVIQRLAVAIVAGALAAIVGTAWLRGGSILAPIAMGLAIFVILGTLIEVVMRAWRPGLSAGLALRRAAGFPLSFWGAALAHIGVGVTLLGLAGRRLRRRGDHDAAQGRSADGRALSDHARFGRRAGRAELQGDRRDDDGPFGRHGRDDDRAGAPAVRRAHHDHDPVGHGDAAFRPDLRVDRRPDAGRRGPGAALLEAARHPDLARRLRHGARRRRCRSPTGGCASASPGARARRSPRRRGERDGRALAAWIASSLFLAALAAPAFAVQPDEVMKDPALEARARALSGELRCMVCQNQSIDDSDAPLARDIRLLIRQRIGEGESNDAVRTYLVSRYGDFILLKPPLKLETLLLWLSAPLTLAAGLAAVLIARRRAPAATEALTPEEEARLAALTKPDGA